MMNSFFNKICMLAIALCCIAVLVTSCDEDEDVAVTDVALRVDAVLLMVGQTQTLIPIITPFEATNQKVTWQSSATDVATINEAGQIEAKSLGTTTITVTTADGGKTATCEVTVQKDIVSVSGVSLNKTELPMLVGDKETLIATLAPAEATIQSLEWESSNEAVVTVSSTGELDALAVGDAVITVTALDGGYTATCAVSVDAATRTITFVTNGGGDMGPVEVRKNEKLPVPTTPTRESGAPEGLYLGTIDPEAGGYTFAGWYTDAELNNAYDFDTPVVSNFTLYAKWEGTVPTSIDLSGFTGSSNLEKAIRCITAATLTEPTNYTFVLASDLAANGSLPKLENSANHSNIILTIVGKGKERTIKQTAAFDLFRVEGGHVILEKNLKITASNIGDRFIFNMNGKATVTMRNNVRIADVTGATGCTAAIYLTSGTATFNMEGGEISNNTIVRVAGSNATGVAVCVLWGVFNMKGGAIYGNKATVPFNTHHVAGGVFVNNWNHFHKTGGVVRDNVAEITAAETGAGRTGQQVFYSANNSNSSSWRKVDDNLGETDNLTTGNVGDPLWKVVP